MSSRKATAIAPSNIAFVKYWGALDLERAIPLAPSISMTLSRAFARTTVEYEPDPARAARWPFRVGLRKDGQVESAPRSFAARAEAHAQRILDHFGMPGALRLVTENSFPSDAGIASSAAGFAALAVAGAAALGRDADTGELSLLARASGSGSAARSVLGGYVEWPTDGNAEAPARQLAPPEHWALCDVIALVETGKKAVPSLDGHRLAPTSPHFARRLELLPERLERTRTAISSKSLEALGPTLEEEAIELHLIAMSSSPAVFYWRPGTLAVLERVRRLRDEGIPAYATMDAGANVHVLCEPPFEDVVARSLRALPEVGSVLVDRVGAGPSIQVSHLF